MKVARIIRSDSSASRIMDWDSVDWKTVDVDTRALRFDDDAGASGIGVLQEYTPTSALTLCIPKDQLQPDTVKRRKSKSSKRTKKKSRKLQTSLDTIDNIQSVPVITHDTPNNWLKFNLHAAIGSGLAQLGFSSPTAVQYQCIEGSMEGRKNVIAAAPTGSGKTLAFGIPILNRILQNEAKGLSALIIAPTRELSIQITDHLNALNTGVRVISVVGGLFVEKQRRLLSSNPSIVTGTPGRLWDLIQSGDLAVDPELLHFIVVDEADKMLVDDRFRELNHILEFIGVKPKTQKLIFSATLLSGHLQKMFNTLSKKMGISFNSEGRKRNCVFDLTSKCRVAPELRESRILCETRVQKDLYAYYFLLQYPQRTMIFVNSISNLKRLTELLTLLSLPVYPLHAKMQQRQRLKNLDRFKSNERSILVCTDVAARGIDIPGVKYVLHYDFARDQDIYVHRSGRTARAGKVGMSLVMISPEDSKQYSNVCSELGYKDGIGNVFTVVSDILTSITVRLDLAREIYSIENRLKKELGDNTWAEKNSDSIGVETPSFNKRVLSKAQKRGICRLKAALRDHLNEPIAPGASKGFLTVTRTLMDANSGSSISNYVPVLL